MEANVGRLRVGNVVAFFGCNVVFLMLLAPMVAQQRELARRSDCRDNLRRLGVAITHYHAAFKQLPRHGTGTHRLTMAGSEDGDAGLDGVGGRGGGQNGMRLSYLVGVLPYIGQQSLWDSIRQPNRQTVQGELAAGASWNPMGPATTQRHYRPWVTEVPVFRCATDNSTAVPLTGRTNYTACLGDAVDYQMESAVRFNPALKTWKFDPQARKRIDAAARGAFVFRQDMTFADITDGLSQTLLLGEAVTSDGTRESRSCPILQIGKQTDQVPNPGGIFGGSRHEFYKYLDYERPAYWMPANRPGAPVTPDRFDQYRGMRWADASTVFTGFVTAALPNTVVVVGSDRVDGPAISSVSSRHPGGAMVLFADGAVQFIIDSIEGGNPDIATIRLGAEGASAPGSKSPYGIWGAMGTRSANDRVVW